MVYCVFNNVLNMLPCTVRLCKVAERTGRQAGRRAGRPADRLREGGWR